MRTETWVKIGEVTKYKPFSLRKDSYCKYAVLEWVKQNGDRKYKEVYIASDTYDRPSINCQVDLNS